MTLTLGDAAMSETENVVLTILREISGEMATKADISRLEAKIGAVGSEFDLEVSDLRSEVHALRADLGPGRATFERRLGDQITALQCAVAEFQHFRPS